MTDFDFNVNTGELVFVFSETVNVSSVAPTAVELVSDSSATPAERFRLTGGTVTSLSFTSFKINLTTSDLNEVKLRELLARTNSSTYVNIQSSFVVDMNSNALQAVSARGVRIYTKDTTAPVLQRFDLNMRSGLMTLTFNEPILFASVSAAAMALQSSASSSGGANLVQLTLSSTTVNTSDGLVMQIRLSFGDQDRLNLNDFVAKLSTATFLSLTSAAATDIEGNAVQAISSSTALQVNLFETDTTPPYLLNFTLNLDTNQLHLFFSEAVRISSLIPSGIVLQDSTFASNLPGVESVWRLSNSSSNSNDGPEVTISLSRYDANNIKRIRALATSRDNTYLTIAAGTIKDLNRNNNTGLADGDAKQAANYITDVTPPQLESYDLIMSEFGPPLQIRLKFSETVDVTSLDFTKLALQDQRTADASGHRRVLTAGTAEPIP